MLPTLCIALSAPTLRLLLEFQGQHGDADPAALADLAIREWLERQRALPKAQQQRGYHWKSVFLPEGTRLRTSNYIVTRYAEIVGDDLVHEGTTMSPNQFVQMSLGSTRSAWHAIRIQMPGSREWVLALRLRCAADAEARRAKRPG